MRSSSILAASSLAAGALASTNYLGFNSGSTKADYSAKVKADFTQEFTTAQGLEGAPGTFNAVRLYTNIQAGTTTDPISAFEAAIDTKTSILLGVWASGTTDITNELTALKNAVTQYGSDFTDLVIGISIGSEDLYRISVTGIANDPTGVGNSPDALIGFISDFKTAFADTGLANIPVGHVDTWDVWTNSSNSAVIDAVDFVGVDEYPYYESGKGNAIEDAGSLFDRAYDATVAAVGGKPVWVTETGWPTTGPDWDLAVPSVENAKTYWDEIGCRRLFNQAPVFWYNLRDSNPANTMKFAITDNLSTVPYFNLTCPTTFDTPTSSSSSASGSSTATATSGFKSGNATGVATATGGTSTATGTASGSSGSGSGSGSSSSSTASGSSSSSTLITTSAAASSQLFSLATYAGLAVAAGVFALF